MANLGNGGFNANEVEPVDFSPLPAGKYLATITKSEMQPTKAGDGQFLKLTFTILEGQYKNRQLFDRLNLQNPNGEAVRIAKGQLSAICRAIGVMQPRDSEELHGIPLVLDVRCEKRADNDEIGNVIKGYHRRDGGLQSGAPTAASTGGGSDQSAAPWKR